MRPAPSPKAAARASAETRRLAADPFTYPQPYAISASNNSRAELRAGAALNKGQINTRVASRKVDPGFDRNLVTGGVPCARSALAT